MSRYVVQEVKYKPDSEQVTVHLFDKELGTDIFVNATPQDFIDIKKNK